MSWLKASVIIPTHNRPAQLAETLNTLRDQSLSADSYEIIVVDDGSNPPVVAPEFGKKPVCRLIRLERGERSAARNAGAAVARGELLVFVDDDISVGPEFLAEHLRAHEQWPDALLVGAIHLPFEALSSPFVRFRQRLERYGLPVKRGVVSIHNFCAAANMAISRDSFQRLGGFDRTISSSEDQDFALRHTISGGKIAYVPEASAIHHDHSLEIRSYCRRAEWGMTHMIPFCRRYPDLPDNIERGRVNGVVQLGAEPAALSAKKLIKAALATRPSILVLFFLVAMLEFMSPDSKLLDFLYRLLLGLHIFRGYRRGLKLYTQIDAKTNPNDETNSAFCAG